MTLSIPPVFTLNGAEKIINTIRVVDVNGKPWFVGADILQILYGKTEGIAWA